MKFIAWIALAVGIVVTVVYVSSGITATVGGEEPIFAWLNGWLIGLILLLFVVPALFQVSRAVGGPSRAFRGAPIGRGTVTGVRRTGVSINDKPQLELALTVDTVDGASFPATTRLVVDLTELSTMKPGLTLPVRYLPGLPEKGVTIARDATPAEAQAALDGIQLARGEISRAQYEIGTRGTDAEAVVMSMSPTGEIRNGKSVLHLAIQITRADRSTFTIEQDRPIASALVPQVQPGRILRVRYLPGDETDYVILTQLNN
ncbi:hypothetical protein [Streptomyces celluloflavus]|uniref:hypothetical protein n=1 Tax=Streptomyces celluloflavus TaxID=58344 RepID=UPI0036654785